MKELLITQAAQLVSNIVITLVGIFAAWLISKLKSRIELKNLTDALDTCLKMTQVTVGELQQKFVEDMKMANEDGKLTPDEIKELNSSLLMYTKEKMTPEIINVIVSAGIDINKLILDAGENYIQELKVE
ncbi:MAG: hypothetical protein LIR46_04395 [Bacteroidota bacterium]|nr:hypothetical protein [Bacteroidota bacterium]